MARAHAWRRWRLPPLAGADVTALGERVTACVRETCGSRDIRNFFFFSWIQYKS